MIETQNIDMVKEERKMLNVELRHGNVYSRLESSGNLLTTLLNKLMDIAISNERRGNLRNEQIGIQ